MDLVDDDAFWEPDPGLREVVRAIGRPGLEASDLFLDGVALLATRLPDNGADRLRAALLHERIPVVVVASQVVADRPKDAVEVVLLQASSWHQVANDLVERLCRPPHGPGITVTRRDVESGASLPASMGDVCGDLLGDDAAYVVVGDGVSPIDRAFEQLTDLWSRPGWYVDAKGTAFTRRAAGPPPDDLLVSALARQLRWSGDPGTQAGHNVADRMAVLIRSTTDGLVPTRTLLRLLAQEQPSSAPHSACAELLDQLGPEGEAYAARLRSLIKHWLQHRIWDVNFVHEMVLHDEEHAIHVDRNVAFLVGRLVEGDSPKLSPRDVYVLAICAWLHDWGHASALVGGDVPTNPMEVRQFHGPLTAYKLVEEAQEQDRHGLADESVLHEVALLCAHHQGWTSCGTARPQVGMELRTATLGPTSPLGVDLAPIGSLRSEYDALGDRIAVDFSTVQELLALLRIADAADIGVHRVPHREARTASHASLLPQLLQVKGVGEARDIKALYRVQEAFAACMNALENHSAITKKEIDEVIARTSSGIVPPQVQRRDNSDGGIPDEVFDLAVDSWAYAKHLCRQKAFFHDHAQVGLVIPTLVPGGDAMYDIVLHFLLREGADETRAALMLRESVYREFGYPTTDDLEDERKAQIGRALERLGIRAAADRVTVKRIDDWIPAAPTPVADVSASIGRSWGQVSSGGRSARLFLDAGGALEIEMLASPDAPLSRARTAVGTMAVSGDGEFVARVVDGTLTIARIQVRNGVPTPTGWGESIPVPLPGAGVLAVARHGEASVRMVLSTIAASSVWTVGHDGSAKRVSTDPADPAATSAVLLATTSAVVALDRTRAGGSPLDVMFGGVVAMGEEPLLVDACLLKNRVVVALVSETANGAVLRVAERTGGRVTRQYAPVQLDTAPVGLVAVRGHRGTDRVDVVVFNDSTTNGIVAVSVQ